MYFKSGFVHCGRWGWKSGFIQISGSFAMICMGQNFILVYVVLQPGWRAIKMPGPEKEILNLNIFFAIANSWGKNAGKVPRKLNWYRSHVLSWLCFRCFFVFSISSPTARTESDVLRINPICRKLQSWCGAICIAFNSRGMLGSFLRSDNSWVQDNLKSEHT